IASYPVPIQDPTTGVEEPGILLEIPGDEASPIWRVAISVVDSSIVSPDSVEFKRPDITVYGPRGIHLPGDLTGFQWLMKHKVSGKWIKVIAFSDSGSTMIQPHRKSIEKLLSTMSIITHRK
ncbi:MAG: hypothetical protein GXO82_01365, partial [Chlorobi bacterium]|nr:hypothetical protein [Chlorobiota bacterium]